VGADHPLVLHPNMKHLVPKSCKSSSVRKP
jgi:hypothetical protein